MKMRIGLLLLAASLSIGLVQPSFPQEIKEIEFKNQLITDILLSLAAMTGKSIIPDETVDGRASYFFTKTNFETALAIFLQTYKLYHRKEGEVYYVSKINAAYNPDSKLITFDCEDVDVSYAIRAVSRSIDKTVLYDPIPPQTITIHARDVAPAKLLEIFLKRLQQYTLETDDDFYYMKKVVEKQQQTQAARQKAGRVELKKDNGTYSITVEKAPFSEIADALFTEAGYEYSALSQRDVQMNSIRFSNKSFEELLRLLLEQASMDYKKVGDVYYIFEISQKDVLKKFKSTVLVYLKYLSVEELIKLFPPDLASSQLFRIDSDTNSIVLSGSLEEIGPIQKFILELDRPKGAEEYFRFDLNYFSVKNLKSVLPVTFKHDIPIEIPNTNSFVVLLSPEKRAMFGDYLKLIDRQLAAEYVKLKYIKAEHLKKYLPPSIAQEDVVETGNPTAVIIKGSPEKIDAFYRDLALLDQPAPQIRYDLLVINTQEGEARSLNQNLTDNVLTVKSPADKDEGAFLGSLGKLFSLKFDVVSNFGYQFAVQLNADISENRAKVLGDTTINGISGEEISFQNTSTFRYREFETDPNTGLLRQTGVVREIQSGLIISMKGWVSGDGMITMDVKSTVSRLGEDTSGDTSAPPPTFEKTIKTNVRCQSGKPIAIGGLITEENTVSNQKTPLLGNVPLLGLFFQTKKNTVDRSEFVIYIVPYAEYLETAELSVSNRIERLYNKFF
jgi:general secretion pathway protein D